MKNLAILKYNLLFAELKITFFNIEKYNYKFLLKYNTFFRIGENMNKLKYIKIIIISPIFKYKHTFLNILWKI